MKDTYHLSVTEQEIMDILWEQSEPMRQTALLAAFNERGKNWGRQTLNTILIRLESRGFVCREKRFVWAGHSRMETGILVLEEAAQKYFDGDREKMIQEFRKKAKSVSE